MTQNNNSQMIEIHKNYLGNTQCNIKITPMEVLVIKKSMADNFYIKYDETLSKIDLYLYS